MDDFFTRFVEDFVGRVHGPMHFRRLLQPLMAISFAIRDGRRDRREGKAPYFWSLLTRRGYRLKLVRDGWKSLGKIFCIALVLDAVYQYLVVQRFYPGEALVTAVLLADVPYLLLRGLVNRLTNHQPYRPEEVGPR